MPAYYNENDPFAAAWLRELIKAGRIAPGEVDERSVHEVQPAELHGFTQCHFFAGIGVWSYALRNAGWPDDSPVWTGSCPCQSFSQSGKRGGFGDPRHLWPAWFRLIRERRSNVVFGEQVASRDGLAWLDVVCADMEGAGYAIGTADLCAAGFGAPHIRQRLYFVADAERGTAERQRFDLGAAAGGLEGAAQKRERIRDDGRDGGEAGLVADAEGERDCDGEECSGRGFSYDSGELDEQPRLERHAGHGADGDGPRRDGTGEAGPVAEAGGTNELVNPASAGFLRAEQLEDGRESQSWRGATNADERGPVSGFWRDAEWLPCRDGKYRPIEPGSAPLVTRAPNRVGRLRGYGNSLTAPVAEAFVRAYMEITR